MAACSQPIIFSLCHCHFSVSCALCCGVTCFHVCFFFCRLVLFGELLFKASLISAHLRGWKHAVFKRQLFTPGLQVMIIFLNKFLDSSIRSLVNNTSGCSERKERCFVLSRPTVQEPNRINLQAIKKIKLYLYFSYGRVTESASHNKTKWDKTEKSSRSSRWRASSHENEPKMIHSNTKIVAN